MHEITVLFHDVQLTFLWKWEDGLGLYPEVLELGEYVTFALSMTQTSVRKVSIGGERTGGPTPVT